MATDAHPVDEDPEQHLGPVIPDPWGDGTLTVYDARTGLVAWEGHIEDSKEVSYGVASGS